MLSWIIGLFGVCLIAYQFIGTKSTKIKARRSIVNLTYEEKRFFMELANALPAEFTLAYQSDVFNIAEIAKNLKLDRKIYRKLKKLLNNREIDFVVLDKNFEICCIIDFASTCVAEENKDFVEVSKHLEIPVFKFYESDIYDFDELHAHLNEL